MTTLTIRPPLTRLGEAAATGAALALLSHHWLWSAAPGLSLAMTIVAIGAGAIWLRRDAPRRRLCVASAGVALAALPVLEAVSLLSVVASLTLLAGSAMFIADRLPMTPGRAGAAFLAFIVSPFWRGLRDVHRWRRAAGRARASAASRQARSRPDWRVWTAPLVIGALFLGLFAAANPLIEAALDLGALAGLIAGFPVGRAVFTAALFAAIWPFLRPPRPPRPPAGRNTAAPSARTETVWFGAEAVLRSLLLFNVLFAAQTVLDMAVLWGGALPDGMTYAAYAHRGAYPLIATALLAAGFVLIALRSGSRAAESRAIRRLVYLWIGQNVLLVASSVYRLDAYVGVYGLTYLRVAAFIWMGLVAVGLCLIVARIALRRSGEWLIGANLLSLSITLFACCFVNFAGVIATWNLYSTERRADIEYLQSLGPAAIGPLDRYAKTSWLSISEKRRLRLWRATTRAELLAAQSDWRAWTRREAALAEQLDAARDPQQYWK